MPTLDELQTRLLRGLDADTQNPAHDALWLSLLAEYDARLHEAHGTCLRRDHVGVQLDARQETQGRWAEQRLGGIR